MKLLHKTRGSAPINGKQLIFVHAAESDRSDRDRVIRMILDSENGGDYAMLYADEPAFPIDFGTPELSRIHLYVPLITKAFLDQCGSGLDFSKLSAQYGFDWLPVLQNADLIPAFNRRFKNIHAITLTMQNPALEIEKLLSRMLVSPALIEEIIRDGFTRRLFLSYRKKDAAEVERIMRAVHNTRWGRAAAIWFDDFLVPGTDFEIGIHDAMKDADAVVFAVTSNLPKPNDEGKPNYVCQTEYPEAVKLGKKLIAVEAEPTPKETLQDALGAGFPKSVPVDDGERMNQAFDKLGGEEPDPDPYVQYLRGMAYLIGVRVEKDAKKAIKMLDECVNQGVVEAAMQLAAMYADGISCYPNVRTSIKYRQRAFHIAENHPLDRAKLDTLNAVVLGDEKYSSVSIGINDADADTYYESFARELVAYLDHGAADTDERDVIRLYLARAYTRLGNIENRSRQSFGKDELDAFKSYLSKAEQTLRSVADKESDAYYRCAAQYDSVCGSLARSEGNWDTALEYAVKAQRKQRYLVEHSDATYKSRWLLATFSANVIGCEYMAHGMKPDSVDEEEARACVDAYESLYAEKKDPVLAMEMVDCYANLRMTTTDKKQKKAYLRQSIDRLQEIGLDFPHMIDDVQMKELKLNREMKNVGLLTGTRLTPLRIVLMILLIALNTLWVIRAATLTDLGSAIAVIAAVGIALLTLVFSRFKQTWRLMLDIIGSVALYFGVALLFTALDFQQPHISALLMFLLALAGAIV